MSTRGVATASYRWTLEIGDEDQAHPVLITLGLTAMTKLRTNRALLTVAAVLAAFAVASVAPSVALAGSSLVPTWTRQATAPPPPGRARAAIAYDAANGTVVMFGGTGGPTAFRGETWSG